MPGIDISELIAKIAAAGVVGAGGGGFPTAFKLKTKTPVDMVIINGAECEPLLKVDQELMARYPGELLDALAAVVRATGARKGIVALKEKYEKARAALGEAVRAYPDLQLHLLPDVYPMGDEHLLTHSVTGRAVPPGGLPLQAGAVVLNVETLYNIHRALAGQPVTHKYITVTGAVGQPLTARVPVGTPMQALLELAGGPLVEDHLLVSGGPLMGKVTSLNAPVTKTTKGILVLPREHPLAATYHRDLNQELKLALKVCCQCMQCTDFCPRHLLGHPLEPHRVMRAVTYGLADITLPQALLCSECGLCDLYACPFGLSPRQVNRQLKAELQKQGFKPAAWPEGSPRPERAGRQVPTAKLLIRLGLKEYYHRPVAFREEVNLQTVRLPLRQSAGAAPEPVVKPGDRVVAGELIARIKDGTPGANLHASINGTVLAVNDSITIREETLS